MDDMRCPLIFKSKQCGYAGEETSCDKTQECCQKYHGTEWIKHFQGWMGVPFYVYGERLSDG